MQNEDEEDEWEKELDNDENLNDADKYRKMFEQEHI